MAKSTTTTDTRLPLFPGRNGAPAEIEIAPGKKTVDLAPKQVRRICVADLIPTGEASTYRAVARVHEAQIRLTPEVLVKLGLGIRHKTLIRLIKAGFVAGERIAPTSYLFDLESYFSHRDRCRANADFWTGENLKRFRDAI